MIIENKRGALAFGQIFILIIGIIAISYAVGSEIKIVSSDGGDLGSVSANKIASRSPTPVTPPKQGAKSSTKQQTEQEKIIGSGAEAGITASQLSAYKESNMKISIQTETGIKTMTGKLEALENGKFRMKDVSGKPTTFTADQVTEASAEGLYPGYGVGIGGNIWQGLQWSLYVVGAIQIIGRIAGYEDEKINAISLAAFGGIMSGKLAVGAIEQWGSATWGETWGVSNKAWTTGGVGIVVAAYILYEYYRDYSSETARFKCPAWQPPTGGKYCEECNKQGLLPCSEYQCRSLGQSCQLINPGTGEEKCVWVNRKDIKFPVITPWENALLDNYRYTPDKTISPPDKGVAIEYTPASDKCVPAFTPMRFGIRLDEPAKCKLDHLRKQNFSDMDFDFGGSSLFRYNHTQTMSLPGSNALALENISIKNDGNYSIYVRCQDSNGNANTANFVFQYCVEKGPDTTPPLIVTTSILEGMPFAYNETELDLTVYVNEPANCKWSLEDQSYENMPENMSCCSSVRDLFEVNAQMLCECQWSSKSAPFSVIEKCTTLSLTWVFV